MDDTFLVWQHGQKALDAFVEDLNAMYRSIKFTKEKEKGGTLAFLDINRRADGKLGRAVYRKERHTERYLNMWCHHHLTQKCGILMTLLECAHWIVDKEHLPDKTSAASFSKEWLLLA